MTNKRQAIWNRGAQRRGLRLRAVLCALLLLVLLPGAVHADIQSDADRYDTALMQLNAYLKQSTNADLAGAIATFQELRGYGDSNGFRVYAEVIHEVDVEGGTTDTIQNYLSMLQKNTDLQERLADEAFQAQYPYIRSVEELTSYVQARQTEARWRSTWSGKDKEAALTLYGSCMNFYDATDRSMAMMQDDPCANGRHAWKAATCTQSKVCTRCGAVEGKPLGHSWKDATCNTPRTCTRCGTTQGAPLGHNWKAATCTSPATCSRCKTTSGSALGHKWKNATCTAPRTCTRCKTTSGSALGHSWKSATCTSPVTCTRCKATQGKALGHKWKAATVLAPKTCTVCGKTSGKAVKRVISAKSAFQVGKTVKLGYFEQDGNTDNGPEVIQWKVLAVKNNQALLISRYILTEEPYHSERKNVTWKDSSLRAWLNGTFYKTAFSKTERAAIVQTTNTNGKAQGYSSATRTGGGKTKDRVFVLSHAETLKYFASDKARNTTVTAMLRAQGVREEMWWWERSPAWNDNQGLVVWNGNPASAYWVDWNAGIRPVIWVNLKAKIF